MNAVQPLGETPQQAARRLSSHMIENGYKPEALHEYQSADGKTVYYRIRLKHLNGTKWIRPMHGNARGEFVLGEPPATGGKPLYRLPQLIASMDVPVWVTEGERKVEVLEELGIVSTTSGSATSAGGTDWQPLAGRRVVIWPDNDEAGTKYAREVAEWAQAVGGTVELVDIKPLGLGEGEDVVDWLKAHPDATKADLEALARMSAATPEGPRPLPDPLPPVMAFDPLLLPEVVRDYCVTMAHDLQVPVEFVAVPVMVGLSAVIGRVIGIRPKVNAAWIEVPLLWGAIVGRPSAKKSPSLYPAERLLEAIEKEEMNEYEALAKEHEAGLIVDRVNKQEVEKAIKRALKAKDAEAAQNEAMKLVEKGAPPVPRLVTSDATMEKLGELLRDNPRGLVLVLDELVGWFANQGKEGREGERGFWLKSWNGKGTFTVDRIKRGTIRIEGCAMCVIGGIQPGKLAGYVRGAVQGGDGDDGLIQRIQLAVFPDLLPDWEYTDAAPDLQAQADMLALFRRLRALDPLAVGAETALGIELPYLRPTEEARELWKEWDASIKQRLRSGGELPHMESHLAKYDGLALRLALVIHLADSPSGGPVSEKAMAQAIGWTEFLESHAKRIYAPLGNPRLWAAHALIKRRGDLPAEFTQRDVSQRDWAGLGREEVEGAVELLVEYGHLIEQRSPPDRSGRPTKRYRWSGLR